MTDCFICAKHADPATQSLVVAADEQVVVAHLPLATPGRRAGARVPRLLFGWTRVDEWPDAPRGDGAAIAALVERLRGHQIVSNANS